MSIVVYTIYDETEDEENDGPLEELAREHRTALSPSKDDSGSKQAKYGTRGAERELVAHEGGRHKTDHAGDGKDDVKACFP